MPWLPSELKQSNVNNATPGWAKHRVETIIYERQISLTCAPHSSKPPRWPHERSIAAQDGGVVLKHLFMTHGKKQNKQRIQTSSCATTVSSSVVGSTSLRQHLPSDETSLDVGLLGDAHTIKRLRGVSWRATRRRGARKICSRRTRRRTRAKRSRSPRRRAMDA